RIDLAAVNSHSNDVSVFLGNGDGTFRDQVRFGVGAPSPNYLLAADLNGDGRLDLVTTNDTVDHPASRSVLLGNADRTVRPPARSGPGPAPRWGPPRGPWPRAPSSATAARPWP